MNPEQKIGDAPHIPIIKALRVKIIGRAVDQLLPPLVRRIDVATDPAPFGIGDEKYEYSVAAEINYRQIAPKDAEQFVREHAVRSICHHIYGPIEQELHLIMENMWDAGMHSSQPAIQRVGRLIDVLRGDSV